MTNELLSKGNITTIATWIAIALTALISYFGIEFDLTPFVPVIAGVITLVIAIYSSKHPNTFDFLGNNNDSISVTVTEDLAESILDLVDKYNANATIDVEIDETDEIEDDEDG